MGQGPSVWALTLRIFTVGLQISMAVVVFHHGPENLEQLNPGDLRVEPNAPMVLG